MSFEHKYLKYKQKYLDLKNELTKIQNGGGELDSESLNVDKLTETPTFEKVFGIQQGGFQQLIDSDSSLDEMLGQKGGDEHPDVETNDGTFNASGMQQESKEDVEIKDIEKADKHMDEINERQDEHIKELTDEVDELATEVSEMAKAIDAMTAPQVDDTEAGETSGTFNISGFHQGEHSMEADELKDVEEIAKEIEGTQAPVISEPAPVEHGFEQEGGDDLETSISELDEIFSQLGGKSKKDKSVEDFIDEVDVDEFDEFMEDELDELDELSELESSSDEFDL